MLPDYQQFLWDMVQSQNTCEGGLTISNNMAFGVSTTQGNIILKADNTITGNTRVLKELLVRCCPDANGWVWFKTPQCVSITNNQLASEATPIFEIECT
jgi:hypothetical protein